MKATWNVFIILSLGIMLSGNALADFVGINIGANHWMPALSATNNSGSDHDLTDDSFADRFPSSLILILKQPDSYMPNFRYQGYRLDSSESNTLNSNLTMNGQSFTSDNRLLTSYELTHDNIVVYYDLTNKWVDLDLGIDLKRFDGEVEFPGRDNPIEVEETIPLIYLSARFDLPYNGFYIGADFNNISLGDSNLEDSTIKLGYESGNGLGFEGGLKSFSLELDDADDTNSDLEYDGFFLNGYLHF